MKPIYDEVYFMRKFAKIPESKWAILTYLTMPTWIPFVRWFAKSCVLGHVLSLEGIRRLTKLGMDAFIKQTKPEDEKEFFALVAIFEDPNDPPSYYRRTVAASELIAINDSVISHHTQSTPKQRIMCALKEKRDSKVKAEAKIVPMVMDFRV